MSSHKEHCEKALQDIRPDKDHIEQTGQDSKGCIAIIDEIMGIDPCHKGQHEIGQVGENIVRSVCEVRGRVFVKTIHTSRCELVPQEPDHTVIADLVIPSGIPGIQPQHGSPGEKLQQCGADKGRKNDQEPKQYCRRPDTP